MFAPPLFLLGPFAVLIALSRPRVWREWAWLVAAVVGLLAWLAVGGEDALLPLAIRITGGLFTGVFVVLAWRRPEAPVRLATLAALAALGATWAWGESVGIRLGEVIAATERQTAGWYATLFASDPALRQAMVEGARTVARLFPAMLFLHAVAGGALAWRWYHWVAGHPWGDPGVRFASFRFNDHLIWGALATLALALSPVVDPWRLAAENGLMVWGVMYAVRGLAVLWGSIQRVSLAVRVALLLATVVLLPFASGGLLAIGLADTWIDVRSRLSPSSST